MQEIAVSKTIKGKEITFKTGYLAKQANGAVLTSIGGTEVLGVATMGAASGHDFFPLSVHYIEKFYASGRIPGNYFRREARPSSHETLISRLIDRPLRPLFPEGFFNEVQIMPTVLSVDSKNPSDVVGMNAASAALTVSDIPFNGPVGAVRVGKKDGKIIVNPSYDEQEDNDLELLVAGTRKAITMIEGEARELTEEEMLEAVAEAHEAIKEIIDLQEELKEKAGKAKADVDIFSYDQGLVKELTETYKSQIAEIMEIRDKLERNEKLKALTESVKDSYEAKASEGGIDETLIDQIPDILHDVEKEIVRNGILDEEKRQDGRLLNEIRPLDAKIGVLKNVHGSAVFTRGETQALAITTLGPPADNLREDLVAGTETKNFFLHYNFPPYSVGETGRVGSTGRREIGHGMLAERSLFQVFPDMDQFGYTVRIVSEILESNGSSSMATVCGGSLALMEAGVPIKKHVAGIAMGLILDQERYKILTDIQGLEDHLGDMDFKVAGTRDGITGFQLDIKVEGITLEIMKKALEQAREARMKILDTMYDVISEPDSEINENAPRKTTITVPVSKIRNVIGSKGVNIKKIVEETGSSVDIDDDGTVHIFARNDDVLKETIELVQSFSGVPEVGKIYSGTVKSIKPFGAFIEVLPGTDGLCHISEISHERIKDVESVLKIGDTVKVKVKGIDDSDRVSLTMKDVE